MEIGDGLLVFLLATLYNVGKSGAHATRVVTSRSRVHGRTPLIEGLPISDLYHGFSGASWPIVLYVCVDKWGVLSWWWIAAAVTWGLIWPASKWLKGLTLRETLREPWYVQIVVAVWSRIPRRGNRRTRERLR
jgi:hypothetical protein